jgi:hypothetical protein
VYGYCAFDLDFGWAQCRSVEKKRDRERERKEKTVPHDYRATLAKSQNMQNNSDQQIRKTLSTNTKTHGQQSSNMFLLTR